MSDANAGHPWLDLVGRYETLSVDGKPIPQEYSGVTSNIYYTTSPHNLDMNGNRIPSLYFYLFKSSIPGWMLYTWIDALELGEFSVEGNTRIYKFSGRLRKNVPEEEYSDIEAKLSVTEIEPYIYEFHDQRNVVEGDHSWSTDSVIVARKVKEDKK